MKRTACEGAERAAVAGENRKKNAANNDDKEEKRGPRATVPVEKVGVDSVRGGARGRVGRS